MRPLELSLRGFRSYRDEARFDWRGRRLVGIVGPIGSGKSSILEGIAFALYGKTPSFDRDTKELIHQTEDGCHVELRFEVDGQTWRAVRALRRLGSSGHQLERLAGDEPGADVLESITGERAVRDRVTQLLGMDFSAFCRSVLLAQNRFADFLKASPKERNVVLKGVFGYERFDAALDAAKDRARDAEAEVAALRDEHDRLEAARDALPDAEARLEAAEVHAEALDTVREPIEAATEAARAAEREAAEAAARIAALADVGASSPDPGAVAQVAGAMRTCDERAAEAEAALAAATEAAAEAAAVRTAVARRAGDQAEFGALVQRLDDLTRSASRAAESRDRAVAANEEAGADVERSTGERDEAQAASAAAEGALARAAGAVTRAETALHERRHADMARTLRTELAEGEPCPVCSQPVVTVPGAGPAPAIRAAEDGLGTAREAETAARAAREEASSAVAAAEARLAAAATRATERAAELTAAQTAVRETTAELGALRGELVDRLGEGDPRALVEERTRELEQATAAAEAAEAEVAGARSRLDEARGAGEGARSELQRLANRLAGIWGSLGEPREIAADPEALPGALTELRRTIASRAEEASARAEAARADAAAAAGALAELLTSAGVPSGGDFTRAVADAAAALGAATANAEQLRATIEAGAGSAERAEAVRTALELATRLAADLQPSRFLAFLLAEERRDLAALGSQHFEELSAGAYRFTADDRFEVIDMNAADRERRADGLSGGETFLASLALALALAEMVARGGGRLDAFFLDEGFGSLDPEHLERAMDGIGRLVANDATRLVVLVSHVEMMRESLEDLIVLDKEPSTGDTVVVGGAASPTAGHRS